MPLGLHGVNFTFLAKETFNLLCHYQYFSLLYMLLPFLEHDLRETALRGYSCRSVVIIISNLVI